MQRCELSQIDQHAGQLCEYSFWTYLAEPLPFALARKVGFERFG